MMFLLRTTFWLIVILALLPTFVGRNAPAASTDASSAISATDAVSAASATVGDLGQFCGRQPTACAVGAQAAAAVGQKAQEGARIVYGYLTDRVAPQSTGSVRSGAGAAALRKASQDTLTPADLAPAWRGPQPRKDAAAAKRPT